MKVAVGLSGGVDSAVAARLLQEAGHEVVGITMTLGRADESVSLAAARRAASSLGLPLAVIDLADVWRREVTDYVGATYRAGATPNPCVRCNERVKFGLLPRRAFDDLGCDAFATGHYARLARRDGRVALLRGVDRAKDQSYFLYRVAGEILERTLLPLGALTKAAVRDYARTHGIAAADSGDSQDFCGGDAVALAGLEDRSGEIVSEEGRVLGTHRGYWRYTVGQRRGLGVGGGTPLFVIRVDAAANRVVVAPRARALAYDLRLADPVGRVDFALPVKVRSAGEPRLVKDGLLGVAPGQSAVFYAGDEVVGGGVIC